MVSKIVGAVLLLMFVGSTTAFGQLKIGYMNTQEVLNQIPERDQVQQKLNSFIQQKRQELQQQTVAFQDSVAKYQQSQSAMNQQQASQAEQRLAQMEASMQKFQQSIQQQIQRRRAELLQPIFNRMNNAISTVAEQKGIDVVLNETTSGGENIIYYASNGQTDITNAVVQQMNETSESN